MPFDIMALKARTRRTVHSVFGVPALYLDATMGGVPQAIMARWHDKIVINGDSESEGYAQVVQTVDRLVLIPTDTPDITFRKGGKITIVATGKTYVLDVLDPMTGPLERVWRAFESG